MYNKVIFEVLTEQENVCCGDFLSDLAFQTATIDSAAASS